MFDTSLSLILLSIQIYVYCDIFTEIYKDTYIDFYTSIYKQKHTNNKNGKIFEDLI